MAITRTGVFVEDTTTGFYGYGHNGVGSLTVNGGNLLNLPSSNSENEGFMSVGSGVGSNGSVSISGLNSTVRMSATGTDHTVGAHIGRNGGTGSMSITAGGRFEIIDNSTTPIPSSDWAGGDHFSVGRHAGSNGNLSVNAGTFSLKGGAPGISIGRDGGTGTATFANGSLFSLQSVSSSPDLVNGGDLSLWVGRGAGADGTLTLNASTGILGCNPALVASETGFQVGRDGGTGEMNLLNGSTFTTEGGYWGTYAQVGRGVGGNGTLNIDDSALTMDGTTGAANEGASLNVGRDSGIGVVNITNNAFVTLSGNDYAHLQIGRTSGNGTLIVDDSTLSLGAANADGVAGMDIGDNSNGSGTGLVIIRNGGSAEFEGADAYVDVASDVGASGELRVLSGGSLTIIDTNHDPYSGYLGIGNAAGVTKAVVLVSGAGSLINAADSWMGIGVDPFSGSPDVGNGLLTIDAGGTVRVRDAGVGRGGTLVGGDGTLILEGNNLNIVNGTMRLLSGDIFEIRAGASFVGDLLNIDGNSLIDFQVAANGSTSGRLFLNGGDALIGADAQFTVTPLGGYQFAAGQSYILATNSAGSDVFFDPGFSPANISVSGQAAGFGYAFGISGQSVVFKALNNGNGAGAANLSFGDSSLDSAQFFYDTATGLGGGEGGTFDGGVYARNLDGIIGTAGGDTFTVAGPGGLTFNGLGGNDTLQGGDGADTLIGGTGADNMAGGLGNDQYYVDSAGDLIVETAGGGTADRVYASVSYALGAAAQVEILSTTSNGGAGAINLTGNNFVQNIIGNAGANTLNGLGGADTMQGLTGDDRYIVDNAGDIIVEGAGGGADRIFTSVSYVLGAAAQVEILSTTSNGGAGAINLTGNNFVQNIIGNAGINTLNGLGGADTMQGLTGNDKYVVDNAGDAVIETTGGGTADRVYTSVSYTLGAAAQVEILNTSSNGGAGAINLTGNNFVQNIIGNAGINTLNGLGGADTMQGLTGNDKYIVDNAGDIIVEGAGGGSDRVFTSVSYALGAAAQVEILSTTSNGGAGAINLTGNNFVQTIIGNAGANTLNGLGGADTMQGLTGNDKYIVDNAGDIIVEGAGGGSDRVYAGVSYQLATGVSVEILNTNSNGGTAAINLTGNSYAQSIIGNAGNNILNGGAGGADTLTGLGGNDIFVFNSTLSSSNRDIIADYSVADDTIHLENAIFTGIAGTGTLTAVQFSANASGTAQDADDRIIYETDTGRLIYDSNGNVAGGAVHFATLDAGLAMTNADFFIV